MKIAFSKVKIRLDFITLLAKKNRSFAARAELDITNSAVTGTGMRAE